MRGINPWPQASRGSRLRSTRDIRAHWAGRDVLRWRLLPADPVASAGPPHEAAHL